jgi:hypothetical protein
MAEIEHQRYSAVGYKEENGEVGSKERYSQYRTEFTP